MTAPLTIVVHGEPAPQGSKSFRGVHGGHGVMVESSKKVKPWRQDVVAAAVEALAGIEGFETFDGPLAVTMVFTLRKPASAPKRRPTLPDKKPDLSKLARSTEDALTTAGVWADDARVVRLNLSKTFPDQGVGALASPGVRITIRSITEEEMT